MAKHKLTAAYYNHTINEWFYEMSFIEFCDTCKQLPLAHLEYLLAIVKSDKYRTCRISEIRYYIFDKRA